MIHDVEPDPHDRLTFRVRSRTEPRRAPYVVDLAAHDGRGECNCTDWRTRRMRDGNCKHVRRAREVVLAAVLWASAKRPAFGQTLHAIVRGAWETIMSREEKTNAKG